MDDCLIPRDSLTSRECISSRDDHFLYDNDDDNNDDDDDDDDNSHIGTAKNVDHYVSFSRLDHGITQRPQNEWTM